MLRFNINFVSEKNESMFKVELPILYHTKETFAQEEMGMDVDDKDMRVGMMTFYSVDAIEDAIDVDTLKVVEGSTVLCSGKFFMSPLDRKTVEEMVEEAMKK